MPEEESEKQELRFQVAPHIVQDLGLNLYTTLPRVIVEFVANAYDADSPDVEIEIDPVKINDARSALKKEWEKENIDKKYAEPKSSDALDDDKKAKIEKQTPLGERLLSEDVQITVTDHGHGMSRDDLANKFLIAGRRRRDEEEVRTKGKKRLVMGRKGLGKLAGFGVARRVQLITRKEGESHATKITLDYDELIKKRLAQDVEVPDERLEDGGGLEPSGTKIILSKLVYGPMGSKMETIANQIGDHFALIKPDEFKITLNKTAVSPTPRDFVYGHPHPTLPFDKLVKHSYKTEEGEEVEYEYRIRFTSPSQHLNARERGVRVYAHERLASAPELLDMKTGIHGFNNTHYLDGIVQADFIDDQKKVDYIATDRQSLRWESSLLAPMRDHLSAEMEKACNEYQKSRETTAKATVRNDPFTKDRIQKSKLPKHKKNLAYRIAATLAAVCDQSVADDTYKKQLPIFIEGLVQGNLLQSLSDLANSDHPDFHRLIGQVMELTNNELGDFLRIVEGRLSAIDALKKICEGVDFKKSNNETELHNLFEQSPWLIDPTFTQFLISDETESTFNKKLNEQLGIGASVPSAYSPLTVAEANPLETNKRPDLVFLLANVGLKRIVIVELKAPNTPLHKEHLDQLEDYMRKTEEWLKHKHQNNFDVEGILIGSYQPGNSSDKVKRLDFHIEQYMRGAKWKVFDILEVLDRTKLAHKELLDVYNKLLSEADDA